MNKNRIREEYGLKIFVNEETYKEYKGTLQDQINELQERIDKAIEYIEDNQEIKYMDEVDIVETEKLLNILKGSDNNE